MRKFWCCVIGGLWLNVGLAGSVAEALSTYQADWKAMEQRKAGELTQRHRYTDAEKAVESAQRVLELAEAEKTKKLAAFKKAQELEEVDPGASSESQKKAYQKASAVLTEASRQLEANNQAQTQATGELEKARAAVEAAVAQVNTSAAQVAAERLAELRRQLEQPRSVTVEVNIGCNGDEETFTGCKQRALEQAKEKAAFDGGASYIKVITWANLQGAGTEAAQLRITAEKLKSEISADIKPISSECKFTETIGVYCQLKAVVTGKVPDGLREGLSPPLADGSLPEWKPSEISQRRRIGGQTSFVEPTSGIKFIKIPGKDFYLAETEMTQGQWKKLGCTAEKTPHFTGSNDLPVETVSWNEATACAAKLGTGYRLPTEEDWEYAARAGSDGEYSKGKEGVEVTAANLGDYAWYDGNSGSKTHKVKTRLANAFGLYDMHGNVWEWTASTEGPRRVNRGGSWLNDPRYLRSALRSWLTPENRFNYLGFRLAFAP